MHDQEEKYFVTSNGDAPEQLYFSKKKALDNNASYVDSFNKEGLRVRGYERESDGTYLEL